MCGFFILIFGLTSRNRRASAPKGFENVSPQYCIACQHPQNPSFYRHDTWFSFFFIPIFRIRKGKAIEVRCSNCKNPMAIYPPNIPISYAQQPMPHK